MSRYVWTVLAVTPWSLVAAALWRAYGGPSKADQQSNLASRLRRESLTLEMLADLPEPMGRPVVKQKIHAAIGPHTVASQYTRVASR